MAHRLLSLGVVAASYTPRRFEQNPLFQIVYVHFDAFQSDYHRFYSEQHGSFRKIITHTANRFLLCGDPREGIARYECPQCHQSLSVPFSCKTRLFCPSCHEKKILLWIEEVRERLLLEVEHRFWTFTIPKRLRYYLQRNRKLFGLLAKAACLTFLITMGDKKKDRAARGKARPGILALIQTHGDGLDFNAHLHLLVTNGRVDYRDPAQVVFQRCQMWHLASMTEIFRWIFLKLLLKEKVITTDVADNLLSWKHSGFHIHMSEPFLPGDGDTLQNRLAYAFRTPVALGRLHYHKNKVHYETKKGARLTFTPHDFLAKLTLHIPNRYQNMIRYAGFYSSVVQRQIRKAGREPGLGLPEKIETKSFIPKWAALIAKVFNAIPIQCPKCGTAMELAEFVVEIAIIQKMSPHFSRAPPQKTFEAPAWNGSALSYAQSAKPDTQEENFNQDRPMNVHDFNQEGGW